MVELVRGEVYSREKFCPGTMGLFSSLETFSSFHQISVVEDNNKASLVQLEKDQ
jgi:hypothetical protein